MCWNISLSACTPAFSLQVVKVRVIVCLIQPLYPHKRWHKYKYALRRPLLSTLASLKRWLFHHLTAVGQNLWHLNWSVVSPLLALCCHGSKPANWLVLNGLKLTGEVGWWCLSNGAVFTTLVYVVELGAEHFLEVVNETLMKLPSNPDNVISKNRKWKVTGRICLFSCHLSVLQNDWWEVSAALNLCEPFTPWHLTRGTC